MKYKEFKEIANNAGYALVKDSTEYCIEHKYTDNYISISKESTNLIFIENERCNPQDFEVIKAAMELAETPLAEREEEKRYIIPLPHLVTTDGEQQYLTHQNGFFACRRDKNLRQTWKEKDLVHVPEEYRGFAVEIEVEKWNYK